jgi:hypothetical protein
MKRMEALERAERFRALQAYGVARRTELGLHEVPVEDIVRRVLSKANAAQRSS